MKYKRGVSGIILTVIMVVLVLALIGIVWGVINNIIQTQSEQAEINAECLEVNIQVTSLSCSGVNNDVCTVTVSRSSSGGDISGVKLIFTNDVGATNFIHDAPGNIAPLGVRTEIDVATGITNASNVEVVAYFTDAATGEETLC